MVLVLKLPFLATTTRRETALKWSKVSLYFLEHTWVFGVVTENGKMCGFTCIFTCVANCPRVHFSLKPAEFPLQDRYHIREPCDYLSEKKNITIRIILCDWRAHEKKLNPSIEKLCALCTSYTDTCPRWNIYRKLRIYIEITLYEAWTIFPQK